MLGQSCIGERADAQLYDVLTPVRLAGGRCVVVLPTCVAVLDGPILRPVASVATASRKLDGGVRFAH